MTNPMSSMRPGITTWIPDARLGLMLIAMMLPLIASPLRHVYDQSLSCLRGLSMTLFALGYFSVWISTALVLALAMGRQSYSSGELCILVASALLWQCSPAKQKCLNRCHRFPSLKALGPGALIDAGTYGLRHGAWCSGSCALVMFVVMSVPNVLAMLAVSLWFFAERFERAVNPSWAFRVPRRLGRAALAHAMLAANRLSSLNKRNHVIPQS